MTQTAATPPEPGSPPQTWEPYALSFDGYAYAGGLEGAEELYGAVRSAVDRGDPLPHDRDWLRAALFIHQRHLSRLELSAPEKREEQRVTDAILTTLRRLGA